MHITVIGESNIDITVKPLSEPVAKSCTPGSIHFHHGGVARNIAHNLCLLGHDVQLVTVFGDDHFAQSMMEECKQLGVDISLSSQFDGTKSPIFLSFNDKVGNMLSAVSDVKLNGRLNLDWINDKIDAINRSDLAVADTLLSVEALVFLIDHCMVPLYIDTVSPNRALILTQALKNSRKKSVFAIKCNLAEAQAMTGEKDAENSAKKLISKGIKEVYLTMGEKGAWFCSQNSFRHFSAIETEAINVTGSGDAFFAGVIHAHAMGIKGEASVGYGLKAACHNIKSEAPVNPTLRPHVFLDDND